VRPEHVVGGRLLATMAAEDCGRRRGERLSGGGGAAACCVGSAERCAVVWCWVGMGWSTMRIAEMGRAQLGSCRSERGLPHITQHGGMSSSKERKTGAKRV